MVLYKDYHEAIEYIDWHLLKLQKITLENLLQKIPPDANILGISNYNLGILWGLIEFIKNLQDVREKEMLRTKQASKLKASYHKNRFLDQKVDKEPFKGVRKEK